MKNPSRPSAKSASRHSCAAAERLRAFAEKYSLLGPKVLGELRSLFRLASRPDDVAASEKRRQAASRRKPRPTAPVAAVPDRAAAA